MVADLAPLAYHLDVAACLEAREPRAWGLFAEAARSKVPSPASNLPDPGDEAVPRTTASADPPVDDLELMLLRHAYRMESEAHPRVHQAARQAADALGVDLPITIYQLEGVEGANASLVFRPDEAVLALSGNVLGLLDDDELVACFGHELAHHRLWTIDGGRVLIADRFLDALSLDAATPHAYLETVRRFDLATELFADRGSLLATGDVDIAIASLVKVATGLTDVDPQAFLRQAEAARPDRGAQGTSHPETVLRAWALAQWASGAGDAAAATLLVPPLDIERLDILDRERLEALTRRVIADVLAVDWMRTDAVVGHAHQFMLQSTTSPTSTPSTAAARTARRRADQAVDVPAVEARVPEGTPTETRRYLAYVLLDFATIDPDLDDEPLVEVLAVAREAGFASTLEEVARKELAIGARPWEALQRRSLERRRGAPGPDAATSVSAP